MSEEMWIVLIGGLLGVLGSSGLWSHINSKQRRVLEAESKRKIEEERTKKDTSMDVMTQQRLNLLIELLMGVSHTQIVRESVRYLEQGWISHSELDTFHHFIIQPYLELGGNGVAKNMFDSLNRLPRHPQ